MTEVESKTNKHDISYIQHFCEWLRIEEYAKKHSLEEAIEFISNLDLEWWIEQTANIGSEYINIHKYLDLTDEENLSYLRFNIKMKTAPDLQPSEKCKAILN